MKRLNHRAGGGNASKVGQITGENDSGRLFQFGNIPDTANAAVTSPRTTQVCPESGCKPAEAEPAMREKRVGEEEQLGINGADSGKWFGMQEKSFPLERTKISAEYVC